jgi:hypothetical protein
VPKLKLVINRAEEALGDIPLSGSPNPGVLFSLGEEGLSLKLFKPAAEAIEHLAGLLGHVG